MCRTREEGSVLLGVVRRGAIEKGCGGTLGEMGKEGQGGLWKRRVAYLGLVG